MLPALANYFGVSVDELIGMDEIAKMQKYDEINRLWAENNAAVHHSDNILLMRSSLKLFPNNALLLVQLSTSLEKMDCPAGRSSGCVWPGHCFGKGMCIFLTNS